MSRRGYVITILIGLIFGYVWMSWGLMQNGMLLHVQPTDLTLGLNNLSLPGVKVARANWFDALNPWHVWLNPVSYQLIFIGHQQ